MRLGRLRAGLLFSTVVLALAGCGPGHRAANTTTGPSIFDTWRVDYVRTGGAIDWTPVRTGVTSYAQSSGQDLADVLATFKSTGTYTLAFLASGYAYAPVNGTWKVDGATLTLTQTQPLAASANGASYAFSFNGFSGAASFEGVDVLDLAGTQNGQAIEYLLHRIGAVTPAPTGFVPAAVGGTSSGNNTGTGTGAGTGTGDAPPTPPTFR